MAASLHRLDRSNISLHNSSNAYRPKELKAISSSVVKTVDSMYAVKLADKPLACHDSLLEVSVRQLSSLLGCECMRCSHSILYLKGVSISLKLAVR
jgi:hypothetical protein